MRNPGHPRCPKRPGEEGFLMVAVIFFLAILIIGMAAAVPRIRASIQRDREVETMERGKQYVRAIQLYYRKFHAYPPNLDALVKTNDIRFLRKKYTDPLTGKDDWKPILFGQNKQPTVWGFFGQPLGGSSIAATGPNGGNGLTNAQGSGINSSGQPGSTSIFDNNSGPGAQSGTGANPGGAVPVDGSNGANGTDANGNPAGGPGNGFGGQTFGGAGIIGFSPASDKQSILVYKKKNHYNEWEFVYDPMSEQMTNGAFGGGLNSQPVSGSSTPIGTTPQNNLFPQQQPTPQQPQPAPPQ